MAELVNWQDAHSAEILARAAQTLAEGGLVVLPTESVYEVAAAALDPAAVAQLREIAGSFEPPAMVLTGAAEALDWLPFLGPPGTRLVRKFGPGAWKLTADGGAAFGLLRCLPEPVRTALCPAEHLALRWPAHPIWSALARRLRQPLVASAFAPPAVAAQDAVSALGGRAALIVNDGRCPGGVPTTWVRATGKQWQTERPGGLSAEVLADRMRCRIVFVCTGNTCRSPMAEALLKQLLAARLHCRPDELPQRGFLVQSAGLAAMMGAEAASTAVALVQEWGADLSRHRSQPLTLDMFAQADHVFAMTASHCEALEAIGLAHLPVPRLLSPEGDDVPDPIGAAPEVYRACALEILGHLKQRLPEIQ